jgi:hypothetical protein
MNLFVILPARNSKLLFTKNKTANAVPISTNDLFTSSFVTNGTKIVLTQHHILNPWIFLV